MGVTLEKVVPRSKFKDEDELLEFLVTNRTASVPKLANMTGLAIFELRSLMASREFRKRATEFLSLTVIDMRREEELIDTIAREALASDTRLGDRVKAAEFLLRHAGLERARETKVDVDHGVRVVFEPLRQLAADWAPPDPFAGVVGAPTLDSEKRETPALPAHASDLDRNDPQEIPEVE